MTSMSAHLCTLAARCRRHTLRHFRVPHVERICVPALTPFLLQVHLFE